jgi:hypothetical protein
MDAGGGGENGALADSSVVLVPVRDNTLFEDLQLDLSSGAGVHLFAGRTGPSGSSLRRRGLLRFDIAAGLPAGAVIDSVSLTLRLSNSSGQGGPEPIELHRVLAAWGEGSSNAGEPGGTGAAAQPGDATWRHTFFDSFDTALWTNPGGDFSSTISAEEVVGTFNPIDDPRNFYSWTGAGLVEDVQSMLEDPGRDFGWILIGNENDPNTAKRFNSREEDEPANQPRLFIRFRPPAPGK